MKIVIIGGVAGGATAAARLRRLDESAEIVIIERDAYISYANCGLPYYIGGTIADRNALQVQTVNGMATRYKLDIRVLNEVISVNKSEKTLTIRNLRDNSVYTETYDKLILSCGAKPVTPAIPGAEEADNVFTLRNIPDTDRIKQYLTSENVRRAVVVGGGFIGVEMAENLTECGVDVTLIEKTDQVLRNFDFEMAQFLHRELASNGVNLILGDGIAALQDKGRKVVTESGKTIDTDMVILAIGVRPENTLAQEAGLKLGARGHVVTDSNFEAIDAATGAVEQDVYAIGDMIEVINALDNKPYAVPLAWGANRQGRLVADRIAENTIKTSKILGTSVIKVFGMTAASTGAGEGMLKAKGIPYLAVHAHRANHASYYPGASNIALKILYDPESGRIFGAQAIGKDGTEKRIDVIATTMRLNGTVYDLSDLELCYAPPFGSAKDPVNILGYIAENVRDGFYRMVHHDEIDAIVKEGGYLLDVRTPGEFSRGRIEGAHHIPVDELRLRLNELPQDKNQPIYVSCQVGLRAHIALCILRGAGYRNLFNVSGGYLTYQAYRFTPKPVPSLGSDPKPCGLGADFSKR